MIQKHFAKTLIMKGLVVTMPSLNTQTKIALVLFTNIMVFFIYPLLLKAVI